MKALFLVSICRAQVSWRETKQSVADSTDKRDFLIYIYIINAEVSVVKQ